MDRVETDGRPEGMKATAALIQRIRKADYDIIYDFQTSGRTKNYFTALSRSGKTPLWSGHHEKAAFFHDNAERGRMHSIDRLAEQLEVAGVPPAAMKSFIALRRYPMTEYSCAIRLRAIASPMRPTPMNPDFLFHGVPRVFLFRGASCLGLTRSASRPMWTAV